MSTATSNLEQVRDAWDSVAEGFDQYVTPRLLPFGEQVLSRLEIGPGRRVLDVAAGSGSLSIPAARMGADVVAIDLSPVMIERLAARGRAEGLTTLEARVGDGEALDVDAATFDVAMSMNGVSLFPDIRGGLREMIRVTRPNGQVLVVTFGPLPRAEFIAFFLGALRAVVPNALPPSAEPMPPFRLAGSATFRRTLEDAGLRDVQLDTANLDTPFDSADHLLETVFASNPIAKRLTAGWGEEDRDQVRAVLDRMLRDRSGGGPGAVLQVEMQIGWGTV